MQPNNIDDKEFYFNTVTANFADAMAYCTNLGAKLFEPKSSSDNIDITDLAGIYGISDFWIGIHRVSGTLVYASDGAAITYTNWSPGNPSGNGPCVQIGYGPIYTWDCDVCSKVFAFVCERGK